VYDIQTSYKGAVYSVKLKMEFSILNQLMNLVKGKIVESSTPYSRSKPHTDARTFNRTALRSGTHKDLGHVAGAYSRMEDGSVTISRTSNADIKLHDLKNDEVLKTTTTEVRFESAEDIDSVDSGMRGNGLRKSSSSTEHIIEDNKA
jgi:hypothetical protein